MSPTEAPEFSRLVPLARLGAGSFRQEIAANTIERAALARRFDIVALDRLAGIVELARRGPDLILLRAAFEAAFVQRCVITLDPVEGAVAHEFALLFGPPEAEADAGGGVGDEIAFEPLAGDAIDIGEAVAQEFSLVLPPFPRSPGASVHREASREGEAGPFAALARLARRQS